MEEFKYKVYVQVDSGSVIVKIESDLTLTELTKWIQIDEGTGDKYAHAQGNYFSKEKPLKDMQGKYNYKLVDGKPVELTEEEKERLFPKPVQKLTLEQQLLETQALLANLQEQILLNK